MFENGAPNKEGSGVGFVMISPSREKVKMAVRLDFPTSNNEAEYESILVRMTADWDTGTTRFIIYSDSQLVVQQIHCYFEAQ